MGSLAFPLGTDFVDVGSGSQLDGLNVATICAWIKTPADLTTTKTIYSKNDNKIFRIDAGGALAISVDRATTGISAIAGSALSTSTWYFVAASYKATGVDGDQKLFVGALGSAAAEVGSYTTQIVGTGTVTSDGAGNGRIGARVAGTVPFVGQIAGVLIFKDINLSLNEIRRVQERPRNIASSICALWMPGYIAGSSVPDFSGAVNTGTVNGAPTQSGGYPWRISGAPTYSVVQAAAAGSATIPLFMNQYRQRWK